MTWVGTSCHYRMEYDHDSNISEEKRELCGQFRADKDPFCVEVA